MAENLQHERGGVPLTTESVFMIERLCFSQVCIILDSLHMDK